MFTNQSLTKTGQLTAAKSLVAAALLLALPATAAVKLKDAVNEH